MNSVIFILRRSFMDSIVQSIVTALSGKISKELIVFLVSMVPLLELRGSILAAGLMKMSFFPSYIAAICSRYRSYCCLLKRYLRG